MMVTLPLTERSSAACLRQSFLNQTISESPRLDFVNTIHINPGCGFRSALTGELLRPCSLWWQKRSCVDSPFLPKITQDFHRSSSGTSPEGRMPALKISLPCWRKMDIDKRYYQIGKTKVMMRPALGGALAPMPSTPPGVLTQPTPLPGK